MVDIYALQKHFGEFSSSQLQKIYPTVVRLQLHLPNMHLVHYNSMQRVPNIVTDECNSRTMLTEFFKVYEMGEESVKYLYVEFLEHYWWDSKNKTWVKRKKRHQVVGRIYAASPGEGERFFLRVLLNHVPGPKSFLHL